MRYFVVRPFGLKDGINFDTIDAQLIRPACEKAGLSGGTTAQFIEAGNIRTDMFEQLLVADIVIADISIHNANVFYELGIRHAFRDKWTVLIKGSSEDRASGQETPFDLKTDRYLSYDFDDPAGTVDALAQTLQATMRSEKKDSPVFALLPALKAADAEKLQIVPTDFTERVHLAQTSKDAATLQLLAAELESLPWRLPGLRAIARAQRKLKDFAGERASWEAVLQYNKDDTEANIEVATAYQRLGMLPQSDLANGRALRNSDMRRSRRAEVQALMGRNAKTLWVEEWKQVPAGPQRQQAALSSGFLERSAKHYEDGFRADRNHAYSGLNALAMITLQCELASLHPDEWAAGFEDDTQADASLEEHQLRRREIAAAVKLALDTKFEELSRSQTQDIWAEISKADLVCLTSSKARRVGLTYQKALAGAQDFELEAARKQLLLYQSLGVLSENVAEALAKIPQADAATGAPEIKPRVLLFTGHRIDAPTRPQPRFPASSESQARSMIREKVQAEVALAGTRPLLGLSGAASGGDILFHEVCAELGIASEIFLVLPVDKYIAASVSDGGPDWVERFHQLTGKLPIQVLSESDQLPNYLAAKEDYSIWQRSNLWMLFNALVKSGDHVTLIALWNGQAGDGPGGTDDMVHRATKRGAKFIHLDASELLRH